MMKNRILAAMLSLFMLVMLPQPAHALEPAPGQRYAGIDVSKWQGEIDFARVASSGVAIVYIRAGAGDGYRDPYFEQNYQRARAAGLKIGFHHSVTAETEQQAKAQAEFFYSLVAGKTHDCLHAMDYESFSGLSQSAVNRNALAFLHTLNDLAGSETVLYTNASNAARLWNSEVAAMTRLWVAEYGVSAPRDNGKWDAYAGWQYSNTGRVPGISGNVDLDHFTEEMLLDAPVTVPGAPPPEPTGSRYIRITVRWGDTLWRIAKKYGTSVSALTRLNALRDPNRIYAGQTLYVETDTPLGAPAVDTYVIMPGDTLYRIAKRFGTSVRHLAAVNEIADPNRIYAGETLDLGL